MPTKKKSVGSGMETILFFCIFSALQVGGWPHILNITSKNCGKAVFLWKNLRIKKNIVSIQICYGKRGLIAEFRR